MITTNDDAVARAVDDHRIMRRGHGSLYDIAVPGLQGEPLRRARRDRALPARQARPAPRDPRCATSPPTTRRVAELDGIEPLARDPRDTHALHLYVVRIDAERAGATRDEYQRALADELIGTSIHFLPVHRLSAYRERYPDQPPLPVAEKAGRRDPVAAALARRTRTRTSRTRSPRCGASTRAFTAREPETSHGSAACAASNGRARAAGRSRPRRDRRHRALRRLHPLADRRQQDDRHPRAARAGATSSGRSRSWALSVWPMAWRWQRLLRARGIPDDLSWLVRAYFVSYTAGQVLPTSIGGDAARIYETTKRHPGPGRAGRRARCCSSARSAARRR